MVCYSLSTRVWLFNALQTPLDVVCPISFTSSALPDAAQRLTATFLNLNIRGVRDIVNATKYYSYYLHSFRKIEKS